MTLQTIRNVELFRIGTHNGEEYTREDLLTMAEAFSKVGYQVPVKVGHGEMDGMPAMGWVSNVRVENDTLIGDMDLQPDVFRQVQSRLYDHVSVEIYFNAVRDGVTFPKALKAVALLGAETPGCAGLKPLREATFAAGQFEKVASFKVKVARMSDKPVETPDANAEVLRGLETKVASMAKDLEASNAKVAKLEAEKRNAEVKAYAAACKLPAARKAVSVLAAAHLHGGTKIKCMAEGDGAEGDHDPRAMLDEIIGMLNKYAETFKTEMSDGEGAKKPEDELPDDAGMAVDEKAKAMMKEKNMDYGTAFAAVLKQNPALAKAYASRTKQGA